MAVRKLRQCICRHAGNLGLNASVVLLLFWPWFYSHIMSRIFWYEIDCWLDSWIKLNQQQNLYYQDQDPFLLETSIRSTFFMTGVISCAWWKWLFPPVWHLTCHQDNPMLHLFWNDWMPGKHWNSIWAMHAWDMLRSALNFPLCKLENRRQEIHPRNTNILSELFMLEF